MREPKEEGPSVARYTMTCPLKLTPNAPNYGAAL
jgi:hypothetical protein